MAVKYQSHFILLLNTKLALSRIQLILIGKFIGAGVIATSLSICLPNECVAAMFLQAHSKVFEAGDLAGLINDTNKSRLIHVDLASA